MPDATEACHQLKSTFCTSPTLIHPDPNLGFVVEVDSSTLGVGAALSQYLRGEPQVLRPCTYFSKKISPAEQNYDIRKCKFHQACYGVAQDPFGMITDHKNLQYLHDAMCLNL